MSDPKTIRSSSETVLHHLSQDDIQAAKERNRGRGFFMRALKETFTKWGARLGLAWVLILCVFAVFAPWLANSWPYAVSIDGNLEFPIFTYIGTADLVLLAIFFTIAVMLIWFRSVRFNKLMWILIGIGLGTGLLGGALLSPPAASKVFAEYRTKVDNARAADTLDFVVWAPIPFDPNDDNSDITEGAFLEEPGLPFIVGTDRFGRDLASQLIHGTRTALGIGFVATGISMIIGILIGALMGYFSGVVDILGMRLVEIFQAIPVLFLLLTFVAFFGRDLYLMMVIIGITGWAGFARFVRAEFLKLRQMEYVQAAIALGTPLSSVLLRHMLPNGLAPVLVAASFGVASAILAEATLSFLGLGPVDSASWGALLNQAVQAGGLSWWMAVLPGTAIFLTVFAYNLIGEALRDAIDPYLKKSSAM